MEEFSSSDSLTTSEETSIEDTNNSSNSEDSSSEPAELQQPQPQPPTVGWPFPIAAQVDQVSDIEMMKERFAKLLLGEDMSGSGKGVCTAFAISNAITNLYATLFGQLWRLEPLSTHKKTMWKREMECLLCVSDHIIQLVPSCQTFPDGTKLEVMTCTPRTDLYINLPALRKLDNMLLEILDSFKNTDFWYVDQGIAAPDAISTSPSFRKPIQRQQDKWWLPVPRIPPGGLHDNSRKQLQHKRECTNQILKAAMAINNVALTEMEIPNSYMEALPKNGRASLGDVIHRYITSNQFSPECLLDCLDLSSEHQALEIANRVEASIYVWRRRTNTKTPTHTSRSTAKSSWGMVKELMGDADKRDVLADRAESLFICLKQRFPAKNSDQLSSVPTVSVIAHKRVSIPFSVSISNTPCITAYTTPSFSPAKGDRSPFLNHNKSQQHQHQHQHRGFGVKKVLTDYLGADKGKNMGNSVDVSTIARVIRETPTS
ncbi:hypothetical protein GIB67_032633 [Kingdonia uniflora]|uniref:PRONE domain-containing protein n=1 Tax=Kingdonia uniflora TaxID=39325 RepID=A0A7J7P9J2_9MAGN|nr:hypothetical protein GIB67_032633 [Kingdonia uniflora]